MDVESHLVLVKVFNFRDLIENIAKEFTFNGTSRKVFTVRLSLLVRGQIIRYVIEPKLGFSIVLDPFPV